MGRNLIESIHDGWRRMGMSEDEIAMIYHAMNRYSALRSELWQFEMDCEKEGVKLTYHRFKKFLDRHEKRYTEWLMEFKERGES